MFRIKARLLEGLEDGRLEQACATEEKRVPPFTRRRRRQRGRGVDPLGRRKSLNEKWARRPGRSHDSRVSSKKEREKGRKGECFES